MAFPKRQKLFYCCRECIGKKGVDLLIDAAAKMDDEVVFLLAGDGPEIDTYKAQAKALNLEHRVIFAGWCTTGWDF
jgi:glycosyltransferase involved in cell wall biosynthesis